MEIYLLFVCVGVCMPCHRFGGQRTNLGIGPLSFPVDTGDQVQDIRLVQQECLPTEESHQSIKYIGIF